MDKSDEKLINRIVYLMQKDDSKDAPADSIQWVRNLFRTRLAVPKTSLVRKVIAVLQLEIEPHKTVFGERSAAVLSERQMLFKAEENQIDLRIAKTRKGFRLKGQILGKGFEKADIKLKKNGKEFITTTNEICEFEFENVKKGVYDLKLTGSNREIVVENIEIG